jgi:hypothetical protein
MLAPWTFAQAFPSSVVMVLFTLGNGGAQLYGTCSCISGPQSLTGASCSASLNGTTSIGGPVGINGLAFGF